MVNCLSRALVTTIPGSLQPDSRDPETETGSLETEKSVHGIHGTLETELIGFLAAWCRPQGEPVDFYSKYRSTGGHAAADCSGAERLEKKRFVKCVCV